MISISILFILLSNAVTSRRDIAILFNRIAILVLIYCILQDLTSLSIITKGISLHGNLLHKTNITQIFSIFIFILSIFILQLTSFYPNKLIVSKSKKNINFNKNYILYINTIYNKIFNNIKLNEHLKIIEYPLILLFIIMGAIFLISANDLISIFLAIELQSYGLYLLSAINKDSELSTAGGLIYFLLGGLSSCFILLGTSILYINSGITNLDSLYILINIIDTNDLGFWYNPYYINFGFLIMSLGFLFKVSAAPFHFWSPDVYDAIPTIVTTFVAIISKISIFILLLELVYYSNNNYSITSYILNMNWTYALLISSFFSLIIGTIVGLSQYRIKRLFAYSTISHVGFILLALGISSIESTQAFIFYLIQYSISNLNIFFILVAIGFSLSIYTSSNKEHTNLIDKHNSPVQLINQLRGFFYINPILSLSLIITLFSFMGIPPLIGFFGKQMVLSAALDKGFIFLSLIAITTSVIGAVYYLNIVKEVFFYNSQYKINSLFTMIKIPLKKLNLYTNFNFTSDNKPNIYINYNNIKLSSSITLLISSITWIIILFIFFNKEWLSMGTILVQILFNT